MKLISFVAIFFLSLPLFSAGMEEVCSYARNNSTLSKEKQWENVRYSAQFTKCMPGFDAKPNAKDYIDNGIKACFFYFRPDHRKGFEKNMVPCVKLVCDSFSKKMDEDCQNYNDKPKRPEHTKARLSL